ncbi:hypothetical protein NTE_01946 [Candidatus Nitrososphaera evergladensis SR1]|jgi:hypothetical protein|uniref:Uncharacterized protein n=1 Tax=Candidatus Nitrososphaera evergladensis SR1 TaxID=1459636 RepID=A0A075MXH0_9ARCH|nr:hypothetical protein [Candidatus Nitrososphaera evergladensis]AIF84004.1 hypothetical protein NTE_01946 [Candidatus Nitrososphaera evergladensis SR1]
MVEKMTAVWLIVLTIIVCAAVPGMLIYITLPHATTAKMLTGLPLVESMNHVLAISQ